MSPLGPCRPLAAVVALAPMIGWMWLAMMLVHELGHLLGAWLSGGAVASVELRPGRFSHTMVAPNPWPSLVLWGGFLTGWIVPQTTAPLWRVSSMIAGPALRAWAAFCLLAGGCYLAFGGAERLTDTEQLASAGWPLWLLVGVGLAVAAVGYSRSRSAWVDIAKRLESDPIRGTTAATWWMFLLAWIVGQSQLHAALQTSQ